MPLFDVIGNSSKFTTLQIAAKIGMTSVIMLTLPVAISLEILEGKTTLMASKKLPTDDTGKTDLKRMV